MKLSFGDKIRNLREDKDLNQTQLGSAVNMTQRKISYIECGKYEPSIDDIIAFCHFFKVSADYLLEIPDKYRKAKEPPRFASQKQPTSPPCHKDPNRQIK